MLIRVVRGAGPAVLLLLIASAVALALQSSPVRGASPLAGAAEDGIARPKYGSPPAPASPAASAVDILRKPGVGSDRPHTPDAYVYLAYKDEPVGEITVTVGTKVVLDMNLNGGSNSNNSAQQSYLGFSSSLMQIVDAGGQDCTPAFEISADTTTFDFVLQNELCNGPQPCDLRGMRVPAGSIAYASGGLNTCYYGCGGVFRVAQLAFCGTHAGRAVLHWQFNPPDPIERDCEIVAFSGELVQNRSLYHDLIVNIIGGSEPLPTPTPCPLPFSDVSGLDYYYEAVRYLYCNGIVSGYGDNTYRPASSTTRGQLCKIMVLANHWQVDTEGGPHFSDVPPTHSFYTYIETAYRNLVISGYSDGTFRPGGSVTRGQLCKVVSLARGWPLSWPPTATFGDVPTGSPFFTYVETAYCHNIISGYADRTFRPQNNATRGQIAKMVYGALRAEDPCK